MKTIELPVSTSRCCPHCGKLTKVVVDTAKDVNFYITLCIWCYQSIRVEAIKTNETNQFAARIHKLILTKSLQENSVYV